MQWYWKTDFFAELSDEAIELHLKFGAQLPTMPLHDHLFPLTVRSIASGGETAFSYREANFAEVILGVDPEPASNERMIEVGQGLLDGAASLFGRGEAMST